MKRLLLLFSLVAFAACQTETPEPQPQPEPEPQPEVKEPKLTLTSEATLEFEATGGEGIISYTLENSVEGIELEAECEAEWVANLTVGENVTFSVAANDVEQVRQTTISVTYGELGFEVLVKQAAKEAEPTPEPEPEYTELPYISGIYFGNSYGATESDYNYSLVLSTNENCFDIITGEVTILENSTYLFLDLYASEPAENLNISFNIPQGDYTLDTTDSAVAGTIGAKYSSLYITNDVEGEEILFATGSVTVTAEGIEAKLYDEAGNEYHYFCPQTVVDNSNNFGPAWAPAEQSTLTEDLNVAFSEGAIYAECYGDYYVIGKNTWMYFVDDYATGDSFCFELLTDTSAELPVGTFPVSNNLNNKQMALPGYLNGDGETMWSWYSLYDDDNSVIGSAPIVGGEITITDNGDETFTVTIAVVDDLGYNLTGECTAYGEFYGTRANVARRTLSPRKM